MAAVVLGYRKALAGTEWAISFPFCTKWFLKCLVGAPFQEQWVVFSLYKHLLIESESLDY